MPFSPVQKDFQEFVGANLRRSAEPSRVYRDYEVDGATIDLMLVDENIVGYMVLDHPRQVSTALAQVPVYDAVCDAVFLVHRDVPEKQLRYFPSEWGSIDANHSDSRNATLQEPDAAAQLGLLTAAELEDFNRKTVRGSTEKTADRDELIAMIADRFEGRSLSSAVAGYLLRRGTAMDEVNPRGSVPAAALQDFSIGVAQDKGAVQMLGLAGAAPKAGEAAPEPKRHMNRQQRRAAARAAQAAARRAAQEETAGAKEKPAEPSQKIRELFGRSVPSPSTRSFRITAEDLRLIAAANPLLADMLQGLVPALNDFVAQHSIPEPPEVAPIPNVPEEYRRRRELCQGILAAVDAYLDEMRYNHTWMLVRQLQDMLQAELSVPDRAVGPDTTPHNVPFDKIEVRPGVPWLPEELIAEFADYLQYGGPAPWFAEKTQVVYTPSTGNWMFRNRYVSYNVPGSVERLESEFGLPDYNGLRVLESVLNLQQPKFQSEDKTAAVMEKQEAVLREFRVWLSRDPWRRWAVEEGYNGFFNQYPVQTYSGAGLKFPGLSADVELYPYQKDAVAQIMAEKNTLLAFDVGAGKTYIMAAAAMNLRAAKKSPKNLFVVPNNIVGQWERIFHTMYPQARLLVVEPKNFTPGRRAEVLRQIRDNDYDGIIMAYSSFELIRLSPREVDRQRRAAQAAVEKDLSGYSRLDTTVAKARQHAKSIDSEAKSVSRSLAPKPGELTLDQLGITTLFLDEAHNFKNVPIRSSLKNVAGVNLRGSQKNLNMLYKIRAIQHGRKRGGVVFATGTPLSNSLSDCYTMQRYLQPDMMHATHLDVFDNWIKSFAKPEYVCEIDVDTSKFRYVNRLSRFYNLPELSHLFAGNAAFYALDETDSLPELRGYTNILIPEDRNLRRYMDELCQRTERIRAGQVPPYIDNMLLISTDGRKAALDLRLVGREQPDGETSKVYRCAQEVLRVYRADPNYTQIVFCDYSTPKGEKFSVYADLKQHLVDWGVPPEEIAFIHSATTEAKKLELYEKMNDGRIRILIGSTFKLGIGANVQTKLKAIHHLDIPWRPADMVQREGRILRKGNTNDEVQIFRYITEGSFDAYGWQILEAKQRFISQFLSGSTYERSASDLEDTVLTYAQVKALAINEPLMKSLAEKQNELRRLRLLASSYVQTQDTRRGSLGKLEREEKRLRRYAERTQENADYLAQTEEQTFKALYRDLGQVFTPEVVAGTAPLPADAREILGFTVALPPAADRNPKKPVLLMRRNGAEYRVVMGDKTVGNARRVVNFFKRFDVLAAKAAEQADAAQQRITGNENALQEGNPYPAQIAALSAEIQQLQQEILERQQERAQSAMKPA